ncbi:HNH endonuclease signature motif containing protein [Microbacterium sp. ARD32]|uniref:HNH endonuclease signature motif containing protein n=1 Tax=Microbacterium sp. ARD32 TaxID=2962577 RepID=UPI00288144B7|nr:HNH endonuclease signature motif containing protein [Microbacterium sp. ARD32]MDT0158163.1 HNH endonuclease signature motif containing protein [Microbacterium sp. ARD32]
MKTSPVTRTDRQVALREEWVRVRRQINALEARAAALLGQRLELLDEDVAEAPMHRRVIERSMIAEFTVAGRAAKGTIEHAFADARMLGEEFGALREALEDGAITVAHVREILTAASAVQAAIREERIPPDLLGLFQAAAIEFAETESPARTRAHARELAAVLAPQTVTDRHRDALTEQDVKSRPVDDELSLLTALLPTHRAEAIMDRLNTMVRHQKQHGEDRHPALPVDEQFLAEADRAVEVITAEGTFTIDPFVWHGPDEGDPASTPEAIDAYLEMMDRIIERGPVPIIIPEDPRPIGQIRAELLSDLLLAADPSTVFGDGMENITARIQVTIDGSTLSGRDDKPAQLDGTGTLHPDTARTLAGRATSWTRLFLDADGMVTHTDTYQPTAGMRRYLRARDQHCRFPGCRQPLHRCETDHTRDWALGGPTSLDNLAHLCPAHHTLKHPSVPDAHRWAARQLPDGTLQWTAPDGTTHLDRPPRRVMFTPSGPPDPIEHDRSRPPGDTGSPF